MKRTLIALALGATAILGTAACSNASATAYVPAPAATQVVPCDSPATATVRTTIGPGQRPSSLIPDARPLNTGDSSSILLDKGTHLQDLCQYRDGVHITDGRPDGPAPGFEQKFKVTSGPHAGAEGWLIPSTDVVWDVDAKRAPADTRGLTVNINAQPTPDPVKVANAKRIADNIAAITGATTPTPGNSPR